MTIPIILGWSGGKDSALALHALLEDSRYEVVSLLTTLTLDFDRISMHGVRRELLLRQAEVIGLPLEEVWIKQGAGNAEYEAAMLKSIGQFQKRGITKMAFGDLFLQDIRNYREQMLKHLKMECVFPIWGKTHRHSRPSSSAKASRQGPAASTRESCRTHSAVET